MTAEQSQHFISAIEAAGITKYSYNTDVSTAYYNDGKTCFVIPDYSLGGIHAVKKNGFAGANGGHFEKDKICCYYFSDFGDIHEVRTAGSPDQIKAVLEGMGLTLDDEKVKILKWMEESTSDLKPITGDYTFTPVSDKEYESMTEEEKVTYDRAKSLYELRKAGISGKASVSIQMG